MLNKRIFAFFKKVNKMKIALQSLLVISMLVISGCQSQPVTGPYKAGEVTHDEYTGLTGFKGSPIPLMQGTSIIFASGSMVYIKGQYVVIGVFKPYALVFDSTGYMKPGIQLKVESKINRSGRRNATLIMIPLTSKQLKVAKTQGFEAKLSAGSRNPEILISIPRDYVLDFVTQVEKFKQK